MDLVITHYEHVTVLQPQGRFDAFKVPELDAWLTENVSSDKAHIIIDMAQVTFIDTRALSILVKWLKRIAELGGRFALCNPRQPVRIIFELSSLDKAFVIYNDVDKAVQAMGELVSHMPRDVADDTVSNVHVVQLSGRFDAFSVEQFKETLTQYENDAIQDYIVDLSAVNFLDSAGLATLVRLLKMARAKDGDVVLVKSRNEAAHRILLLTKFDKVFTIFNAIDDAHQHFTG